MKPKIERNKRVMELYKEGLNSVEILKRITEEGFTDIKKSEGVRSVIKRMKKKEKGIRGSQEVEKAYREAAVQPEVIEIKGLPEISTPNQIILRSYQITKRQADLIKVKALEQGIGSSEFLRNILDGFFSKE